MLSLPPSVRLFVATQPVDGRKGPDSLMVLVREVFGHDRLSGHLFIFFSKRLHHPGSYPTAAIALRRADAVTGRVT